MAAPHPQAYTRLIRTVRSQPVADERLYVFKSEPAYNVTSATPLSVATAWRACVPQPQLVLKMLQLGCVGTLLWSCICGKASTTSVWHGHHLKAHVEISATGHPEHPDRTRELLSALKEEQLLSRCYKLPSRAVSFTAPSSTPAAAQTDNPGPATGHQRGDSPRASSGVRRSGRGLGLGSGTQQQAPADWQVEPCLADAHSSRLVLTSRLGLGSCTQQQVPADWLAHAAGGAPVRARASPG